MSDKDETLVEMHHQTIMLSTILLLLAKQEMMPDKYFTGYSEGIRKHELPHVPAELREAVRTRSGDFFESLSGTSKKGFFGDMLDMLKKLRGL